MAFKLKCFPMPTLSNRLLPKAILSLPIQTCTLLFNYILRFSPRLKNIALPFQDKDFSDQLFGRRGYLALEQSDVVPGPTLPAWPRRPEKHREGQDKLGAVGFVLFTFMCDPRPVSQRSGFRGARQQQGDKHRCLQTAAG